MISFKKIIFPLLVLLLAFSACKKDEITDDTVIINPPATVFVSGSISGVVMDANHQPLAGASISVASSNVVSDENGVFLFRDIQLADRGALVTAEKDGYFYSAKFVRPTLNKMSFTKFKLTEKVLSGSFESTTGGTISTNGDATVSLPANGIKLENGGAYNGAVNVYAIWIDPTGEDLYLEMPGDLRGMNTTDEQVQLTSFGMIGVELEGNSGQALNLADGQTATIEMPIPSTLLGNAPATIPLWHFDESSGIWVEEGEATLQGNKYVGTVGHFSFWNCDIPNDFIDLTGSVINEGGGIQNVLVQITDNTSGSSGYGYTNQDGIFNGFVPNDVSLTITINDVCGNELYTAEIGPFSADVTLDPIVINNTNTTNITVSGSLEDCDMAAVTNGYVKMEYDGAYSIIPLNNDGTFSGTNNICSATDVTLTGFDLTEFKQSLAQSYDVSGTTTLDAGAISVCDDIEEYFVSNIGSESVTFFNINVQTTAGTNDITVTAQDSANSMNGYILITVLDATAINTAYTPSSIQGVIGDFTTNFADCTDAECDDMTAAFQSLNYTNAGDVLQGNYEGTMYNQITQTVHDISGSFRVIKD
ncbi:MAG: hypothetical protein ACI9XB_001592 [Gammaproteobacteria bacterium]|jgi:hypothetical protein